MTKISPDQIGQLPLKAESRHALANALAAGRSIIDLTKGINEHRLWADKPNRAAVENQFAVISEVLARLHDLDPAALAGIDNVSGAIAFGTALLRNKGAIDYGNVWRSSRKELPELLRQVEKRLATS